MNYTTDRDYEVNPYYAPLKQGLEIVGGIDYREESWEFNLVYVWKRLSDNALFWAQDSGCSCPDPFAGLEVGDLNVLESWDSLIRILDEYIGPEPGPEDNYPDHAEWTQIKAKCSDLVVKVRAAVHGG